ncbi:MAG: hypothetical protein AAFQ07_17030, partial [Chloroflexota bacterium]
LIAPQPTQGQSVVPLASPMLALNTVERDRIVLYDVTNDQYRDVQLGIGEHHVWDFSPDGCRLLLTYTDGSQARRLYSIGIDGSNPQEMASYTPERIDEVWDIWEPDWSPDGTRIAFTLRRTAGNNPTTRHIAHVRTDTDDNTVQFYSVTGRESSPLWSPDSAWLVYISYTERVPGENALATAIPTAQPPPGQTPLPPVTVDEGDMWIVSADGELKYQLTNFEVGSIHQPRWSPDSELISFVWSPQNSSDMVWMIANQPAAIATQLSYEWSMVLDSTWLLDATGVISSIRDFKGRLPNTLWQLPLVSTDDGTATQYASDLDLTHADFPRFSPQENGRWLAVRSAYTLVIVDTQTNTTRTLNTSVQGNTPAVWSPIGFAGEGDCSS